MAPQYQAASRTQKMLLLDTFVALTGYVRKYAMWLLNHPVESRPKGPPARPVHYGSEVQQALYQAWQAANQICTKRLMPFLPTLVETLERHGHLHLSEKCRNQLLSMSAATADRLLRSQRKHGPRGISTTQAGTLLKHQIPIRTFQDWNETQPGFLEADLVAHCGRQAEGGYLYTLTLTDIATGWTECLPLLYRSRETVLAALQRARTLFPFPILGIDTDNGGEFLNEEVVAYCEQEHITFTRGRPYQKRDQCFVEQKNGAIVRQVVGYDRLVGEHASRQLTELYRALRLYVNCFQPSMKLLSKQREGKKVRYVYDPAKTPLQRLLQSGVLARTEATRTDRGGTRARPRKPVPTTGTLTTGCLPLCCQYSFSVLNHLFCTHSCLFRGILYDGKRSCREERTRSSSRTPYPVPEQERRKRVLGWRRTRKDPFEGEWEQIMSWLVANPEREQRRHLPGTAASLPRTLSTITNPHPPARHAENTSSPLGNARGAMANGSDPWPITPAS